MPNLRVVDDLAGSAVFEDLAIGDDYRAVADAEGLGDVVIGDGIRFFRLVAVAGCVRIASTISWPSAKLAKNDQA